MRGSPKRHINDWKKVKVGIEPGHDTTPKEALQAVRDAIADPQFATDTDTQMWVVGGFAKFYDLLPPEDQTEVLNSFLAVTTLTKVRFLHLLDMAKEDPEDPRDPVEVLADIRSSLKATRTIPGPPLPGEQVYPREGFLGQYLNYTQESRSPLAYHFWMGVALLGAACRRNVYMECGYRLYPNQYLFFVGPTAEGKGVAFSKSTSLMEMANEMILRETKDPTVYPPMAGPLPDGAYPNRLVNVLPEKPTPQWLVSGLLPKDLGPPVAGVHLRGLDSVGWLANEEVSAWMGRRDNVYEGCVHIITAVYNCLSHWKAGTQARGVEHLRNMCLTCLCASNIEWINRAVTPDMFAGGFIRRTLFINRNRSLKREFWDDFPPPLDPLQAHVLASQMMAWMTLRAPIEIELAPEAKPLYGRFTRKLAGQQASPEEPNLLYHYLGKYNFVMKLAMVLTISRHSPPGITEADIFKGLGSSLQITERDLERAIGLIEHEEQFLTDCFERIGEHHHAGQYRKILEVVSSYNFAKGEPMSLRELKDKARSIVGDVAPKRIKEMVLNGELAEGSPAVKIGRPPKYVWVPDVLGWDHINWCREKEGELENGDD